MSERVLFHVQGVHTLVGVEGEKPDNIEVINVAEYDCKDGVHYVRYEEIMEGTEGITKNMIKIKQKTVEVVKRGAIQNTIFFQEGQTRDSIYFMPEGQMRLGVHTRHLRISEEEDGLCIRISYATMMNSEPVSECDLTMRIQKKAGA